MPEDPKPLAANAATPPTLKGWRSWERWRKLAALAVLACTVGLGAAGGLVMAYMEDLPVVPAYVATF
jgi:hypothetical protein